ncbi:hypothetical protein [Mycolicibacterium sp. 050158]|uniref:hypothetical protein n=1 Tax=Mycolicibacterium sp. 050158 TaxID=3090602 RepID=UPI00299D6B38|nr:hypothetical protein [Mycolicibacterium sp. 050158]MDX1889131.1 hypothetical protein [Mycolicibacterium sp. 050158]
MSGPDLASLRARLPQTVTLGHQCWLFVVGSSLFALATVPGFATAAGVGASNVLCFVGSWFFTSAAWVQLVRAGPEGTLEWYSAAVQFGGTVLFNVSTGAAVWAHAVMSERRLVWAPDATGSLAFLVSAVLGVLAVSASIGAWAPEARDWHAGWVNMIGCIAFGASAVGAFVYRSGGIADQALANLGTFLGALCFLVAALLLVPRSGRATP